MFLEAAPGSGGTCGTGIVECPDTAGSGVQYKCAVLGCEPEYLDWASLSLVGSEVLHVTGNAIVPSSVYDVRFLKASGTAVSCRSPGFTVETARYGDTDDSGTTTIADVVNVIDAVKLIPTVSRRQVYVRSADPRPDSDKINVKDIVFHVDALKLVAFQLGIEPCP